jgi:threonylcarbamoyladenosine tRNA methylthiotransferase MtaB
MMIKRASLHTLGCRLNQAETTILGEGLRKKGYEIVEFGEPTDLLVLNTCSVTEEAERTSRYLIRKTLKHSPQAFVAVTGCYAQTGVGALARQAGIDLVIGNQYKLELPSYLPPAHALQKRSVPEVVHTKSIAREDFILPDYGEPDSTRALLKIQDGCGAMCSFCIIPFARGHERSRRLDDVVREAENLASKGYREVVLTGVNIGQYRQDGHNLCALVRVLERTPGLDRIRISSIEPTTVTDELLDLMAGSEKLCPYLHIPLQSGDDAVLSAMNRRHTVRDYVSLIERALTKIPGVGLGTDLMVGFPGETDQAFRNTVAVATELPFSYLHVFSFSPRPGTAANRMPRRVPAATVKRRADLLQSLSRNRRLIFHRRQIGVTLPVLFEQTIQDGYRIGTAPNFAKVAVPIQDDLANQIRPVVITAATERWAIGRIAIPRERPHPTAMIIP